MHIYLENIKVCEQRAGGVTNYWCELAKRLIDTHQQTYFIEGESAPVVNIHRSRLKIDPDRIIKEPSVPVKVLRYLPLLAKMKKYSLLHSGYYRVSLQRSLATIITVYDFTYERYRSGLARLVHSLQKKIAIAKADGIICISHNTKRDLMKFYPLIDENKIKVIHLGVSHDFYPLKRNITIHDDLRGIISQKYLLFVGGREGYKNFHIAVDLTQQLSSFIVVIVGGKPLTGKEIVYLDVKLGRRYKYFGGIDNTKLNILYNNAFCFIYPTSYEGFGIPILESMRAGCPVVTTKCSSIPEVCGNAALMVEKIESDAFEEKVRLLEDKEFRRHIINLGFQQANKFSWDTTFNQTLNFYNEIYSKKLAETHTE